MLAEQSKWLILEINILRRAVFGVKVQALLTEFGDSVVFVRQMSALWRARRHIPLLSDRRGFSIAVAFATLDRVSAAMEQIDSVQYSVHEQTAWARIYRRDPKDWPIVATALMLGCPTWTEDRDFFGCGIAIWTSQTIEIYLRP